MLEKRSRRLGVWKIAKKATSTPLNPKSQAQNQGKEDQAQKQYLVFLVKRKESRDFDLFFFFFIVFMVVFLGVWKRENTQKGIGQTKYFKKNVCPLDLMGAWGYLQPQARFSRWWPLQGRQWPFNGRRPQTTSDWADLNTLGQIFIFNF